jgi:hypothetical protein
MKWARNFAQRPALDQLKGDLTAILTNLEMATVFIDEIHAFRPSSKRSCIRRWRTQTDIIIGRGRVHGHTAWICGGSLDWDDSRRAHHCATALEIEWSIA